MKKVLLALFGIGSSLGAWAGVETKIVNDVIVGLSTDGRYASSEFYGTIVIYDLDTDEFYSYEESETRSYGVGNGNFWGNAGMVGYIDNAGGSAIWRGGRWNRLPLAATDDAGMGNANGITPDMSRICGNASTGAGLVLDDAKLMVFPCYWDAFGNTYSQQKPLPYPTTDMLGQVPQYVTALSITEDGKTIWGQITSANGFFHEPIVYHQDEEGKWSYDLPMRKYCLPEGTEIVPYPGDGPAVPSMENFMTAEELAAYDAAYEKYLANPSGMKEPTYDQFMSPEGIAAYNKALEPYLEWYDKYKEYETMLLDLMDKSISFAFNLLYVSPNGRYVAMCSEYSYHSGLGETTSLYTPYLYDSVTGELTKIGLDGYSMLVTAVNDNGEVLGYLDAGGADLAQVYQAKTGKWISYVDYLTARAPELKDWIAENWTHEVEVELDPETGETDFMEMDITGRPFVSADWNSFVSFAYNFWGGENRGEYLSYIIRFDGESSIDEVASELSLIHISRCRRI
ncbi:MAG: hypothetical protein K2K82_08820, partial [Muribaculaceae bacterium]|nr:hypothetical protein [Muribaculaceae bacterium]